MRKLSVFIEGKKKTLTLDKSLVVTEKNTLFVKTASVFWDYKNIIKGENDEILYNGVKHKIEEGYWSFDMLKNHFESDKSIGLTLTRNTHNSTCTIKSLALTKLYNFGTLLGFEPRTILKVGRTTSPNKVNINRGLKFIEIHCDTLVDESINTKGKRSSVISTLPITTESSLNGGVTQYVDIESRAPVRGGAYNNLVFHVETNTDHDVKIGDVLLDIYII